MQLKGHGEKFSRKKEAAIAALMTQKSLADAARSVGIGVATLRRWMQDAQFDAAYRKACREVYLQDAARLKQVRGKSMETLATAMDDPNCPPGARMRAARGVLRLTSPLVETGAPETGLSREEEYNLRLEKVAPYREKLIELRRKVRAGEMSMEQADKQAHSLELRRVSTTLKHFEAETSEYFRRRSGVY
jgi:transposase-like protein